MHAKQLHTTSWQLPGRKHSRRPAPISCHSHSHKNWYHTNCDRKFGFHSHCPARLNGRRCYGNGLKKSWRVNVGPRDDSGDQQLLNIVEDILVNLRSSILEMEQDEDLQAALRETPDSAFKDVLQNFRDDLLQAANDGIPKVQEARENYLSGGPAPDVAKLTGEIVDSMSDKYPLLVTVGNVGGSLLTVWLVTWLWSFLGVDAWQRWHGPPAGLLQFAIWTTPHALFSFLFWQKFLADKVELIKAYCTSRTNLRLAEWPGEYLKNANNTSLWLEATVEAFESCVIQQGAVLNLFAGFLGARPVNIGDVSGGLGALVSPTVLPKVLRVPLEILGVGALSAAGAFTDASILPKDFDMSEDRNPLAVAETAEELRLLSDPELTRQRSVLAASLFFTNGAYLTAETIATNSLFTPIVTYSLSMFIALRGMQQMKSPPQESPAS